MNRAAQHYSDQARIAQLETALADIADRDVTYMPDGEVRFYFADAKHARFCFQNARAALNGEKAPLLPSRGIEVEIEGVKLDVVGKFYSGCAEVTTEPYQPAEAAEFEIAHIYIGGVDVTMLISEYSVAMFDKIEAECLKAHGA